VDVARTGYKAGSRAYADENFPREQLPVGGKGYSEIAQRHPGERTVQDAARPHPVDQMTARDLHGGVSDKNTRGQKSRPSLAQAELAGEYASNRRMIGVISGESEADRARAN